MAESTAKLKNNFKGARATINEYLSRTICTTGKQIVEATKENMYPGHFEDTSLSKDNTVWEQLTPLSGRAHVRTAYAGNPEFGTVNMAPRPAMTPAVMRVWPDQLHRNWRAAPLLPRADEPGDPLPAIDKDGNPVNE